MIGILLFLGQMTVGIGPASPTVGDRILVEFPVEASARIALDPSPDYELVSTQGNRVVLRSFRPGDLRVSGRIERDGAMTTFRDLEIRIASVLQADDSLQPAPLKPPQPAPADSFPLVITGAAGALALLAWLGVILLAGRKPSPAVPAPPTDPRSDFERIVRGIRGRPQGRGNFIVLGDALRRYLARIDQRLGRELTTRELEEQLQIEGIDTETVELIIEILTQADLAKFSPWGPGESSAIALAERALALTALAEREAAA
ncbi:MAG TPA: hypothetical protein VMT00_03820 [Thermoanaerobaculia bacterium]|nr:hypothetical protein [Thermoanaerobaculia bacterium]